MKAIDKIINPNTAIGILILFHVIGAVGIKLNPGLFLQASMFNLILSAVLVFWFSGLNSRSAIFLIVLAVAAFVIEVIGVTTEMPFGSYVYGENLGPKLMGVPLIIAVNWVMLLYCCNVVFVKQSVYAAALYSALLMILLDYIMEQNVEKLGFWFWKNSVIPFQNYVSWFVISFVFSIFIRKWMELKPNKPALALYVIQIVFFTYCYFVI